MVSIYPDQYTFMSIFSIAVADRSIEPRCPPPLKLPTKLLFLLPSHSCFAVTSSPIDDYEVDCCLLLAAFEVYTMALACETCACCLMRHDFSLQSQNHVSEFNHTNSFTICVCRRLVHYTYIPYEKYPIIATSSRLRSMYRHSSVPLLCNLTYKNQSQGCANMIVERLPFPRI